MKNRGPGRRLVIDWPLQLRFMAFNALYFVIPALAVAALAFSGPAATLLDENSTPEAKRAAAGEFLALHSRLWPALLVIFFLFALHSFLVSHRIAGPLRRFRRAYRAIGDGDLSSKVGVSQHEYLPNDAAALNDMTAALKRKLAAIKAQASAVEVAVECTRRVAEGGPPLAVRATAAAAAAEVAQLRLLLGEIRTDERRPADPEEEASTLERESRALVTS
jgi:methyl-accepting chemotaxis protein